MTQTSTRPLWTLAELCTALGVPCEGDPDLAIGGVSIDSRTIASGDLFIAIKGEHSDGHAYVGKALQAGAVAAIVAKGHQLGETPAGAVLITVRDTQQALEQLGIAARARTQAKIIAVTGSVGKTGTKEALRACLSDHGATHAAEKSYNNHWGVPLTLARMPAETDFGIFEIGMNHAGEIAPLTKMVRPDVAIVTTVAPVHLGHFSSVAEIAQAKAEIFEGLAAGGIAIINRDISQFGILETAARAGRARIESFGEAPEAENLLICYASDAEGSDVTARIAGHEISYRVGAPGAHLVMNSLAVLSAVAAVGVDVAAAAARLATLSVPAGRGARSRLAVNGGELLLIDESYNANPASVAAALAAMSPLSRKQFPRRIAVLGDMLELGESAAELHQDLAGPLRRAEIDRVYLCGPLMRHLYDKLPESRRGAYAPTSVELTPLLLADIQAGDAIMIKGSLGSKMGPVVDAIRKACSAPVATSAETKT